MSKHAKRNELARQEVTVRELRSLRGGGFVIRALDKDHLPPRITTVVQQPGQPNITVETVTVVHERWNAHYLPDRYREATPTESESIESVVARLGVMEKVKPLAHVALQYIAAASESL